ncbi:MAG: PAS domain S-box protein, partial [Rhodospirillales bacterium]|nr:PAS domain S-box protein [Rhodospirillales bacterium]
MPAPTDTAPTNWESIVDQLHESIILTDADAHVVAWNQGAQRLFQYTPEEAIGLHLSRLYADWDATEREVIAPLMATGHVEIVTGLIRKSGEYFEGHIRASLIRDADGAVVGMAGYTLDVTGQKQRDEQLRTQAAVIDQIHDSIVVADMEGRIISWNQGAERLFGYTADEVMGHDFAFLYAPSEIENDSVRLSARVLETGNHVVEVRARHKSGEEFYSQTRLSLLRDAGGNPSGIAGYTLDITRRKAAEAALRQANAELEARVEARTQELRVELTEKKAAQDALADQTDLLLRAEKAAHVGHFRRPYDGSPLYWSDEMYRIFGVDKDTFVPTRETAFSFFHPDDRDRYVDIADRAAATGAGFQIDVRIRRSSGEIRHLWLDVEAELSDLGAPIAIFGVVKDVTEIKEAELALRDAKEIAEAANKAKSEFLSSMSHELRTPLNSILGFSQLLESDPNQPLTRDQKDFVGEVQQAARHLVELVNDVLDFAKIESGILALEIDDQPPKPIIDASLAMINASARQRGITVVSRVPEADLPMIRVDPLRYKQALLNLLSNAV